jgi:integrase
MRPERSSPGPGRGGAHHDRILRDRALVGLHCYSGLRPNEIAHLRLSDVRPTSGEECVVTVWRAGQLVRLLIPAPGARLLLAFAMNQAETEPCTPLDAYLFRGREASDHALTRRAVRIIVQRACARAGFPTAGAADLRAAFAYWLRLRGLSDHETAAVLGLQRVKSLDRLLTRHEALDAQRRVRELLLP